MEKDIVSTVQKRSGMVRRSGKDRRIKSRMIPYYCESLELEDVKEGMFENRKDQRRKEERRSYS